MKAIKKTVQGIAISVLVTSQFAFAGASNSLKKLCNKALSGEIVNEVRISRYIESWTKEDPGSYVVIDGSTNIYANSNDGFTSLQLAATKGHTDIVSYLRGKRSEKEDNLFSTIGTDFSSDQVIQIINQGVNINARDNDNYTPLSLVAALGQLNVVEHLIKYGADIEAKDRDIWTPLHAATYHGQLDMVKYLVEKGADFNAKGKNGKTPYNVASERGHSEIAEFLGSLSNYTTLQLAAKNDHLDAVKRLIEKGADVNTKDSSNSTPLHWAAANGHLGIVKYLVENDADVYAENDLNLKPIDLAEGNSRREVIDYLNHAKTEIENFISAAASGDNDRVKSLIQTVPNIDSRDHYNYTALHWAADSGHLDAVKYLVENGANIEAKDSNGRTSLHWAALSSKPSNNRLEIVKYLVGKGASVYAKNNEGNKPSQLATQADVVDFLRGEESSIWNLCNAAKNGNFDNVKNYANKVSSIDGRGEWGYTPLHWATDANHLDIAKYLIEKGANVEAKDSHGRTSLHWAAKSNRLDVVKYLLRLGANIDSKDNNGWTPLHWAADSDALSVVEYLSGHNEYEHKIPYRVADSTVQQHQVVRVQQLAKLAYLTGQKVSMCIDTYHSPSEVWIMEVSE